MNSWLKFKIISLLNRKPDTCWANLVMWAMSYQSFSDTFGVYGNWKSQICREGNKGIPYAYCGKCEQTGLFYKQEMPECH